MFQPSPVQLSPAQPCIVFRIHEEDVGGKIVKFNV